MNDRRMRCNVIIPAAGSGTRFGAETPKQYLTLRGRPLIAWTIERFAGDEAVDSVIVCAADSWLSFMIDLVERSGWRNVQVIAGGATRRDSVINGVRAAEAGGAELVAVHDAVRPFVRASTFQALLESAREHGASLPAIPVVDTIHRVRDDVIVETPARSGLYQAQTPQCFRLVLLKDALERAVADEYSATDEAAAVARLGTRVHVIVGDLSNVKITHPSDLETAEANFAAWSER